MNASVPFFCYLVNRQINQLTTNGKNLILMFVATKQMISQRLRLLRGSRNQAEVSVLAGVEQTTISNWENNPPTQLATLTRIAKGLGVSADYLLGLSDDWRQPGSAGAVLTPEEDELITLWRSLTNDQRTFVLETLGKLHQWSQPRIIGSDDND